MMLFSSAALFSVMTFKKSEAVSRVLGSRWNLSCFFRLTSEELDLESCFTRSMSRRGFLLVHVRAGVQQVYPRPIVHNKSSVWSLLLQYQWTADGCDCKNLILREGNESHCDLAKLCLIYQQTELHLSLSRRSCFKGDEKTPKESHYPESETR